MSRWNAKTSTLVILSGLICIMLLIVILPDVDLLDIAFHQGTAPLVLHARGRVSPVTFATASPFAILRAAGDWHPNRDVEVLAANIDPNFRPILLRSIRR